MKFFTKNSNKLLLFAFIFVLIFVIIYLFNKLNCKEGLTENPIYKNKVNNIEIVISRYNEDLNWLKNEPFNKYPYIVYNKGPNSDYYKSSNFIREVSLENIGRESHTYLYHIIQNYNNKQFANTTIFLPGSVESSNEYNKYNRTKQLFYDIEKNNTKNKDIFSCVKLESPMNREESTFIMDNYKSTNPNNYSINQSSTIELSIIRPFGKWYKTYLKDINPVTNYATYNSIFAITKKTIVSKPVSFYNQFLEQLNTPNPEVGHYIERSWDAIFYIVPSNQVISVLDTNNN